MSGMTENTKPWAVPLSNNGRMCPIEVPLDAVAAGERRVEGVASAERGLGIVMLNFSPTYLGKLVSTADARVLQQHEAWTTRRTSRR